MRHVFIDIETASKVDLGKAGSYRYLADPSTEPICVVFRAEGAHYIWAKDKVYFKEHLVLTAPLAECAEIFIKGARWVAHNGNRFDRVFWDLHKLPQPEYGWDDTLAIARMLALPAGLDRLSLALGIGQKADSSAMKKWMRRPGEVIPEDDLHDIVLYCIQDVALLDKIYREFERYAEVDRDVREADYAINMRGIPIDTDRILAFALKAIECRDEAISRAEELGLSLRELRSPKALRAWYKARGHVLSDVRRDTIKSIRGEEEGIVFDAREQASRTSFGKYSTMLAQQLGSRLRFQVEYHAAHTGRWGGRGVQPQNFKRPSLTSTEISNCITDIDFIAEIKKPTGEIFSSLLRACISSPKQLTIVDLWAIEVVGVAWIAGEDLSSYEAKKDPYLAFISYAFKQDVDKKHPLRQAVKAVVLGCQYEMGADKLALYAKSMGIDLSVTGMSNQELVQLYREARSAVRRLWRNLERAIKLAIHKKTIAEVGRCKIYGTLEDVTVELPSGRPLVYRNARIETRRAPWGAWVDQIEYRNDKGAWVGVYGGKILENITQAICRDVFAHGLVECEKRGIPVVFHVHDEIIAEGDRLNSIVEAMTTRPSWAKDFPIHAEGGVYPYYGKA